MIHFETIQPPTKRIDRDNFSQIFVDINLSLWEIDRRVPSPHIQQYVWDRTAIILISDDNIK